MSPEKGRKGSARTLSVSPAVDKIVNVAKDAKVALKGLLSAKKRASSAAGRPPGFTLVSRSSRRSTSALEPSSIGAGRLDEDLPLPPPRYEADTPPPPAEATERFEPVPAPAPSQLLVDRLHQRDSVEKPHNDPQFMRRVRRRQEETNKVDVDEVPEVYDSPGPDTASAAYFQDVSLWLRQRNQYLENRRMLSDDGLRARSYTHHDVQAYEPRAPGIDESYQGKGKGRATHGPEAQKAYVGFVDRRIKETSVDIRELGDDDSDDEYPELQQALLDSRHVGPAMTGEANEGNNAGPSRPATIRGDTFARSASQDKANETKIEAAERGMFLS